MVFALLAGLALLAWLYLVLAHGGYWLMRERLGTPVEPVAWPSVVAVVPARNEAGILPDTLPALLAQDYPGDLRVVLVDDASTDGTGDLAGSLGADVVAGSGPPPGWTGKVAALAAGVRTAGTPEFLLFTDADIRHPPGSVRALVAKALADRLDLVSLMARLRTDTAWERAVVPAFVYFFAQLYPFRRVNRPHSRTAAAAGGCVLLRRDVLESAGGLAEIAGALIDDVALATLVKRRGSGRIWLGLSTDVTSLRPYPRLADLWDMIARSAYTQLRYSPALLAGTVAGLALLYAVPIAALFGGALTAVLGLATWLLMAGSYVPMLRAYRLPLWWAPLLPGVAMLYAAMTVDSAWRHVRGRGGAWKGRTAPDR
ncbi:MAG TPA: glycosyltransferase [Pseudonocardiaceae bacterium]|nr:glycosyltransferase [Pseudonocardiaceae bacterium]